jgi:hypothetical protein
MGWNGDKVGVPGRYQIYLEIVWPGPEVLLQAENDAANPDAPKILMTLSKDTGSEIRQWYITFIMESNQHQHTDRLSVWMQRPVVIGALKKGLADLFTKARDTESAAQTLTGSTHRSENPSQETDNSLDGSCGTNRQSANTNGSK